LTYVDNGFLGKVILDSGFSKPHLTQDQSKMGKAISILENLKSHLTLEKTKIVFSISKISNYFLVILQGKIFFNF
jgi:flagellin-specific chaperone FliS